MYYIKFRSNVCIIQFADRTIP